MIRLLRRAGLDRPWKRYLAVAVLSVPFAFGLRAALQRALAPDVAEGAVAYLRHKDKRPLSETLARALADPDHRLAPTQPHPLLGRQAVGFALCDHRGDEGRLDDLRAGGPVVLVFYYGYHCPHCVAQLFGLNEDLQLFAELGARVVAVSADAPEKTASRFAKHGGFGFPVLSDPGDRVAELYGAYRPAREGEAASLSHATFLIDASGTVFWAYTGDEPFLDNKSLLRHLASRAGAGANP